MTQAFQAAIQHLLLFLFFFPFLLHPLINVINFSPLWSLCLQCTYCSPSHVQDKRCRQWRWTQYSHRKSIFCILYPKDLALNWRFLLLPLGVRRNGQLLPSLSQPHIPLPPTPYLIPPPHIDYCLASPDLFPLNYSLSGGPAWEWKVWATSSCHLHLPLLHLQYLHPLLSPSNTPLPSSCSVSTLLILTLSLTIPSFPYIL